MAGQASLGRSLFYHDASAFGMAGQFDRPIQQTIPTQAAVSLSPTGGHGNHSVADYSVAGLVSFGASYVTVGGSLDETNNCHATYACSVVEDLNIGDMVTADKVVSRLSLYHPCDSTEDSQTSFSIFGSYFENLRIAGRQIDIQLTSHPFNNSTYRSFNSGGSGETKFQPQEWMVGYYCVQHLNADGAFQDTQLEQQLEHNARVVKEVGRRFQQWDKTKTSGSDGSYRCSAVAPADLAKSIAGSGMTSFGGAICVPRFGVVYLGELLIHQDHRHFMMLRVQMNSPASGNINTGGTNGGGHPLPNT